MKEAEGGAERQDQQERCTVPSRRDPCGTDGAINFGGLDVLSFVLQAQRPGQSVFIRGLEAVACADANLKSANGERILGALEID